MEKGAKFSHYTIEKKIGEGGMGEVFSYAWSQDGKQIFISCGTVSN